jgi:hypothetical protein
VPFEKDLKANLIRETFDHITSDRSTLGESEGSQWQQMLPVGEGNPLADAVAGVMNVRSGIWCRRRGGSRHRAQRQGG